MAKKTPQTREELLAALETLDNSTEIATRDAQIAKLTAERDDLIRQRKDLERTVKALEVDFETIRQIVRKFDRVHRPINDSAGVAEAQRTALFGQAEVISGIKRGTHDPATGLPFTPETQPIRDLNAGASKVTKTELASIFPELSGPTVDVTEEIAAS